MHILKGFGITFLLLVLIVLTVLTMYASYLIGLGLLLVLAIFVFSNLSKLYDKSKLV